MATPRKPGAKRGTPPKYREEFNDRAAILCLKGATDQDLADEFEVDVVTIWRWKNRYPDFCNPLKAAKDIVDDQIERSLYERARGYSHKAVKIFMPPGSKEGVVVEYIEHYPPDPTSMIYWLKNRRPEKWRERKDEGDLPPGEQPPAARMVAVYPEKSENEE